MFYEIGYKKDYGWTSHEGVEITKQSRRTTLLTKNRFSKHGIFLTIVTNSTRKIETRIRFENGETIQSMVLSNPTT